MKKCDVDPVPKPNTMPDFTSSTAFFATARFKLSCSATTLSAITTRRALDVTPVLPRTNRPTKTCVTNCGLKVTDRNDGGTIRDDDNDNVAAGDAIATPAPKLTDDEELFLRQARDRVEFQLQGGQQSR